MGQCTKCGTNLIGTAASPPSDGLCRYCAMDKLTDALDMQRDEFRRIVALGPDPEILGICERAISEIEQTVPVVVQRDDSQKAERKLRGALLEFVRVERMFGHHGQHPDAECADCRRMRIADDALGHGYIERECPNH